MNSKKIKLLTILLAMIMGFSSVSFGETIAQQAERLFGPFESCPVCGEEGATVVPVYVASKGVHWNYCNKRFGSLCVVNPEKHTFVDGKCTKCKLDEFYNNERIKITTEIDENGRLIINMDHDAIEKGWIERINIDIDGEKAIYLRDLSSAPHQSIQDELWDLHYERVADLQTGYTSSRKNPYAMIRADKGNEIQIMWKRIALIINPGTELANQLATGQHEFQVELWRTIPYMNLTETSGYNNEDMSSFVSWYKGKTTIETKFEGKRIVEETVGKSVFSDFQDPNHWAWENVCRMAEKGIVKGIYNEEDRTYSLNPDEPITAEAFMALLARVLGYEGQTISTAEYIPIPTTYWSIGEWKYLMNYIDNNTNLDPKKEMQRVLADNGMNGTDEEIVRNYRSNITREKAGYLLSLFLKNNSQNHNLAEKFEDWDEVEIYYRDSQYRLYGYDILRGIEEDGKLYIKPDNSITRVQAITFIDRFNSAKKS